ncbi:MAG: hypothetical protein HFH25_06455 [Lachnospiraceae bacterium]|nr:hypothetical protein [Lachnospiraceae bacterium]
MKKYGIAGILLAVFLAGSLFLPPRIMEWQDRRKIGTSQTEEVQEVVLREQVFMTLTQRLALLDKERQGVDTLALLNGKNFTQETIEAQVLGELRLLVQQEILEDMELKSLSFVDATVSFFVDLEDTEKSTMVWYGEALTNEYQLSFQLDDESGKIISISQRRRKIYGPYTETGETDSSISVAVAESSGLGPEELKEIGERWGEYLGCTVTDLGETLMPFYINGIEEQIFQAEAEAMMRKGYSEEEAYRMTLAAWGISESEVKEGRKALLTDEGGEAEYCFHSNQEEIINIFPQ